MKKRKWWLIPVGAFVVLLIIAGLFWQTLLLYIAPNLVLANALSDRISQLEDRLSATPIPILLKGIDEKGRNQIDMQLQTNNDLIGQVRYNMRLQLEQNPRRIFATGHAAFQNREMDLSLYLDGDFAAVSSEGILAGNYYGLTYDTFSQDIRSNKWISVLIGESVIRSWESKITSLQAVMQQTTEIPDISDIDFKRLTMGLFALDADVERVSIESNGTKEKYHVISYEATGEQIASGMSYLNMNSPAFLSAGDEVEISFWMQDHQICKVELEAAEREVEIYWGTAPVAAVSPDDLYIQYYDGRKMKTLYVSTNQSGDILQETISCTGETKTDITYEWNASTGDLSATVNAKGESTSLTMRLKAMENGFSLETEDFGALMHVLAGTNAFIDSPCQMTVTKGTEFETPVYKNFADCSLEDLLTLLSGMGSLIGIKMP